MTIVDTILAEHTRELLRLNMKVDDLHNIVQNLIKPVLPGPEVDPKPMEVRLIKHTSGYGFNLQQFINGEWQDVPIVIIDKVSDR